MSWSLHQQQQTKETANPAEKKIVHVLLNAFLFLKTFFEIYQGS